MNSPSQPPVIPPADSAGSPQPRRPYSSLQPFKDLSQALSKLLSDFLFVIDFFGGGGLVVVGAVLASNAGTNYVNGEAFAGLFKTVSDGKQIHWAMLQAENPVYPKNGTSTEYFQKMLLDKNYVASTPGAFGFGGPGFPAGTPPGQFKAENVAWMLLADAADAPPKLPLLLSRNVKAEKTSDLKGRIADTLADRPPFGGKGLVLILKDGSAHFIACARPSLGHSVRLLAVPMGLPTPIGTPFKHVAVDVIQTPRVRLLFADRIAL